jgi:hypothetical protein
MTFPRSTSCFAACLAGCSLLLFGCAGSAGKPELDAAFDPSPDGNGEAPDAEVVGPDGGVGKPDKNRPKDATPDRTGDTMKPDPTAPAVKGSVYTYTFGDTVFAVDASKGGRIVTFSLAGKNILTAAKNSGDNNWGSTFWPSPQSDWNWPPPTEIDPGAYTASVGGAVLSLSSPTAASLGLAVTKTFSVDAGKGVVTIEYGLANRGSKARSVGPWEITRVAAGGLTFFPMGEGTPSKGQQDLLDLQMAGGVAWFAYDAKAISGDQKVFADGSEGWIAHVDGDLLLVKAFSDTTPAQAAPGEAEIEIYTDSGKSYIEVEYQGAYASLPAGESSTWTVRWYLRKLAPSIPVKVGSVELLGLVRELVNS